MRPTIPALLAALALAPVAAPTAAQDAPPEMVPTEGQNFTVAADGPLTILGDPARYDIVLPADLLFDFDESTLRPDAGPLLAQLRDHFVGLEPDQVHVRGHTDSKGSDEYNLTLSLNRATAVCDWLRAEAGLETTNCIGRGEMEPIAPNEDASGADDPEGRQLNRRVTVSVVIYPDTEAMLDEAEAQADAALEGADVDAGAMLDAAQEQAAEALEGLGTP